MQARDIPNLISVLRILLTVPVVWMLLEREYGIALMLFAVAGVSDGLDGFLAKHYGWESRLGGLLDPIADKILLMSSFLVLGGLGLIPFWLVLIVILRDLVIVTGALVYHLRVEELDAAPSLISKLNTVVQILLIILVVLNQGLLALPAWLLPLLIWLVSATTVLSGINYVWVWSRRAAGRANR